MTLTKQSKIGHWILWVEGEGKRIQVMEEEGTDITSVLLNKTLRWGTLLG